jgi:hypothetical protein
MATKSILKEVNIRNKGLGRKLVNALEYAKHKGSVVVRLSKPVNEIRREQIKEIFSKEVDDRV